MSREQMETENVSSRDFVKERIKARPIDKKKLFKKSMSTVLSSVIFGIVFCLCFFLIEPRIDKMLHKDEKVQFIEFPEAALEEEMLPENMLTDEQNQMEDTQDVWNINDYQELQNSLTKVAEKARRSVVLVTGTTTEENWFESSYENKHFSAGVVVGDNGQEYLILVKLSTLKLSDKLVVVFYNEKQAAATIKQIDVQSGYGVVAVKKEDLSEVDRDNITVATLGSSNLSILIGRPVIALGNPIGTGNGICYGNITSVGKPVSLVDGYYKLMTTDIYGSTQASGVLVNMNGHVIGIIDNSYNTSDMKNIISALGISEMKSLIQNLSNDISIPYLGVQAVSVTTSVNTRYGVPFGAYLTSVELDSPAILAGLQAGDVITEFAGKEIKTVGDLVSALLSSSKGETVQVIIDREVHGGYTDMSLKITLQ